MATYQLVHPKPTARLFAFGIAVFLLMASGLACGRDVDSDPPQTDDDPFGRHSQPDMLAGDTSLREVPLSGELLGSVNASLRSLVTKEPGDPATREDLDRYSAIQAMFLDPATRDAAEDSLFALWSAQPRNVLWPDLAAFNWFYFRDPNDFGAMFDQSAIPDTTTALGAFLHEWEAGWSNQGAEDFGRIWARRDELEPFPRAWLTLRLCRQSRLQGRGEEATLTAISLLPTARELGGYRFELETWIEISRGLALADHLDDALHAVSMAARLASVVADETGNPYLPLRVLLERAEILGARREVRPALEAYRACADSALAVSMPALAEWALNYGGIFTAGCGRLEEGLGFYRRSLALSLAAQDSLSIPRHLANLGRRHLLLGQLDSCRVYFEEAKHWIDAYPDPSNRRFFPLMEAEYYAQVGEYSVADSLLEAAAELAPMESTVEELAERHLQAVKLGMERGRPEQAYRSISVLESLRGRLQTASADRNEVFDLDLAVAEFLGRQGQYTSAAEALQRAADALERRPDPSRGWLLERARGDLARRRGDDRSAEDAYRACAQSSEARGDEDRLAESRLLLASVLLDEERLPEAKDVARTLRSGGESLAFGGRFRTKLSASILDARIDTRSGNYASALTTLESARATCTPGSPPDLLIRIALELGRVHAGLGQVDEANEEFGQAAALLAAEERSLGREAPEYLDADLRREVLEAWLELELSGPEMELEGAVAVRLLQRAEALVPGWAAEQRAAELEANQLIYFVGKDASFRWSIGPDDVELRRIDGETKLFGLLAPVLSDLEQPHRTPVPREWQALAAALGGEPSWWRGPPTEPRRLRLVPDGILYSVPWAGLPRADGGEQLWLDEGPIELRDAPVSRVSMDAVKSLKGGETRESAESVPRERSLLALGFDGSEGARVSGLDVLHHAEREAREVASLWPSGRVSLQLGERADLRSVGPVELRGFGVIHIASHALVYRGAADRTTLLLAGCAGEPLTSSEIQEFGLGADLVFLSCCESAEATRRGASPAHAGLARSFLASGAKSVIASSRRIDDEAARVLALAFYRSWLEGDGDVAVALRNAQLSLRDGDPRWAHPSYWASYQVIGGTSSEFERPGIGRGPTLQSEK
ncbi:MAG: CHAT domain-containing protein [Candidatus Eisenbacteria bacterium]|uniref:CHAT domain-containing protein n=1 Tax=Eiseniibacteriota bacterium TaxID=2212470 RepID=A0A956SG22_UNCEI|nr:CHAT domain-containing protein [Candidatus Eisenbacteria bacterium]